MKTKNLLSILVISALSFVSCNGQKNPDIKLTNRIDPVSYAIGMSIGGDLNKSSLEDVNLDVMMKAMKAGMHKDSLLFTPQQAGSVIQSYMMEARKKKGDEALAKEKKWMEENGKKPGVITLPDGLQYTIMKEGTGPKPTLSDTVVVHYHGTFINGEIFDSSVNRGEPATFTLTRVIQAWTEALQMMPVGSKWKLYVPSPLAYGEQGYGGKIEPNTTLIFEVELLAIKGK